MRSNGPRCAHSGCDFAFPEPVGVSDLGRLQRASVRAGMGCFPAAHRSYPTGPNRRTFWATPAVRRQQTLHHELADTAVSFSPPKERSAEPGARDCCLPGNGPIGHRGNGATPAHDGRTGRRSGASPRLTTDGSGPTSRVAKHVAKEREGIEVDEALGDQPILKGEAIAAGHVELASSARRRNVEFDVDVRPGGRPGADGRGDPWQESKDLAKLPIPLIDADTLR